MNAIISPTEQLLLQCQTQRSFTRFYSVLSQTDVLNVPAAAKTWQNELGVSLLCFDSVVSTMASVEPGHYERP